MAIPRYFVEDMPRRKFRELDLKGGIAVASVRPLLSLVLAGAPVKRQAPPLAPALPISFDLS